MNRKFDWVEIQKYYDEGYSRREASIKFGCSNAAITNAVNRGEFKSRNHSIAGKLWKRKSNKSKNEFDWVEIQKYYDEGHSWREIIQYFGCCDTVINEARKKGLFKTRSRSKAAKLAHLLHPEQFKHSDETKKKISGIRKKYLEENPDKVPYLLNHYSKGPSYPEKYFIEVFDNERMDLKYHKQVKLYQLDFYNEEKMLDVEIDGNQHYSDEKIAKSDKKRNQYLEDLGWIVFRIKWSDYKKLPYKEKQKVINEIKKILEP